MDHGWYLIEKWERNDAGKQIDLTAVDLSRLVADDDFTAPATPLPGATFASEFARLVSPYLVARIDPRLADRPVPDTVVWEASKIDNLAKLCDAWPARWHVNDAGEAYATLPYAPVDPTATPDYVLTDGISAGHFIASAHPTAEGIKPWPPPNTPLPTISPPPPQPGSTTAKPTAPPSSATPSYSYSTDSSNNGTDVFYIGQTRLALEGDTLVYDNSNAVNCIYFKTPQVAGGGPRFP